MRKDVLHAMGVTNKALNVFFFSLRILSGTTITNSLAISDKDNKVPNLLRFSPFSLEVLIVA